MNRTVARKLLIGVLALLPVLAGCGGMVQLSASAAPAFGEVQIELKNLQFQPRALTVKAGTRITFVNRDTMVHDVLQISAGQIGSKQPGFASPILKQDESWSIVLTEPGTYPLLCAQAAHYTAGMAGSITVLP